MRLIPQYAIKFHLSTMLLFDVCEIAIADGTAAPQLLPLEGLIMVSGPSAWSSLSRVKRGECERYPSTKNRCSSRTHVYQACVLIRGHVDDS